MIWVIFDPRGLFKGTYGHNAYQGLVSVFVTACSARIVTKRVGFSSDCIFYLLDFDICIFALGNDFLFVSFTEDTV